jgi:hypothetical protein
MLPPRPVSRVRPHPRRPTGVSPAAAAVPVVPFDHAARFELTGTPGNVLQDVINVGVDGAFVAVGVGYGLEEERGRPASVRPAADAAGLAPGDLTLGDIPASALIEGFRLNPAFERLVFEPDAAAARSRGALPERAFSDEPLAVALFTGADENDGSVLLERVQRAGDFSFLLSIVDSATGRELQDEPIHNLASLGRSDGERPFRVLARPLTFVPGATLRLQIVERSEDVRGTLFIVFYGYKILATGCADPWAAPVPHGRVIPFDYVTTFRLAGRPGQVLEDEVHVSTEGAFVATDVGYGLEVEDPGIAILWENADDITIPGLKTAVLAMRAQLGNPSATVDLDMLPLRLFPTSALQEGIRVKPEFLRIAFAAGGALNAALPGALLDRVFERLNVAGAVSFRYAIFDSGRGIELQNQPIHNVAGLGAADGARPFKKLARPMVCVPRSTIRVRVEEHAGRGTLFIVFQGFKQLEAGAGERA